MPLDYHIPRRAGFRVAIRSQSHECDFIHVQLRFRHYFMLAPGAQFTAGRRALLCWSHLSLVPVHANRENNPAVASPDSEIDLVNLSPQGPRGFIGVAVGVFVQEPSLNLK